MSACVVDNLPHKAPFGVQAGCRADRNPIEVRSCQVGPGEVGSSEVGLTEVGPSEVDPSEVGITEVGA